MTPAGAVKTLLRVSQSLSESSVATVAVTDGKNTFGDTLTILLVTDRREEIGECEVQVDAFLVDTLTT